MEKEEKNKIFSLLEKAIEKNASFLLVFSVLLTILAVWFPKTVLGILIEITTRTAGIAQGAYNATRQTINNTLNEVYDYYRSRRWQWLAGLFIYFVIMTTFIMYGINNESNWPFFVGAFMLLAPMFLVGFTLKSVGNVANYKRMEGFGVTIIALSSLLLLTGAIWMTIHSFFSFFILALLSIAFFGASFLPKSPKPLESMLKLSYFFIAITLVVILGKQIYEYSPAVQTRIDSWTDLGKAKNELASVENVNEAQSTKMNADEAKVVPRWIATYNAKMFTVPGGKVVIDTVFINNIVRIEKSKTKTTPDGRIWVWATNEDNENSGWVNQMAFKPLTDEELRNMMSRKGL